MNYKLLWAINTIKSGYGQLSITGDRGFGFGSSARSSETFRKLWLTIQCWQSFWYVTDGYKVYPKFIESVAHLVSKTYMTRVEGDNSRLRHPARSFTPTDFVLLQVLRDAQVFFAFTAPLS